MTPIHFPEANARYGAPEDLAEQQVMTIHAWHGPIAGGSLDGEQCVVVAWSPSPEELELLKAGQPIYISMVGGLAPHFLTMNLEEAKHPA